MSKEQFFPDKEFIHNFEYYDPVHKISLNGRSWIITLELSKLEEVVEKPVLEMSVQEQWAVFFRYLTDKERRCTINEIVECEEGIAMASEVLMTISKDEIEQARLLSEEKYELDTRSWLIYAERKGKQEGKREGEQKIIDLLKSGKSPEEIIRDFESK